MDLRSFTITILGVVTLAGCGSKKATIAQVEVYSLGRTALNDNSKLVKNYGGYAIRIEHGTAVLRMFRISNGSKVEEFKYVLDSSKHRMAWITPRVSGADVEIEFGIAEKIDGGMRSGTVDHFPFSKPHLVGSNTTYAIMGTEEDQKMLFNFWVLKQEGLNVSGAEDGSEASMLRTSKAKPVDFLLFTVASQ